MIPRMIDAILRIRALLLTFFIVKYLFSFSSMADKKVPPLLKFIELIGIKFVKPL